MLVLKGAGEVVTVVDCPVDCPVEQWAAILVSLYGHYLTPVCTPVIICQMQLYCRILYKP